MHFYEETYLTHVPNISDLFLCVFFLQHGINLKHPEYFADSPSAGMAPSTREEQN
jgi:hypothetical protein